MKSVTKSESLTPVSNLLWKFTLDFRFTRPRFGHLCTQHAIAKISDLELGRIAEIEIVPHSFAHANTRLESISAITMCCPS